MTRPSAVNRNCVPACTSTSTMTLAAASRSLDAEEREQPRADELAADLRERQDGC